MTNSPSEAGPIEWLTVAWYDKNVVVALCPDSRSRPELVVFSADEVRAVWQTFFGRGSKPGEFLPRDLQKSILDLKRTFGGKFLGELRKLDGPLP